MDEPVPRAEEPVASAEEPADLYWGKREWQDNPNERPTPGTLNYYERQNRPTKTSWEKAKHIKENISWMDNGVEVMINPVQHIEYKYKHNFFFFGPTAEWKENINEKYLFRPKAFNEDDEKASSLKGHFNSKGESLYPKLIKSINNNKVLTLQDKLLQDVAEIRREGKKMFIIPKQGKKGEKKG